MNWISHSPQNNINVNEGFCIPDKLPDEKDRLIELAIREKMYVYILFKLKHNVDTPNSWLSSDKYAMANDESEIFETGSNKA